MNQNTEKALESNLKDELTIDVYQTPDIIITRTIFASVSPEDIDTNSEVSLCKC